MPLKDRCQHRVPVDPLQPRIKARAGPAQVFAAAGPAAYHGRQHIQRAGRFVIQIQLPGKLIGKHLPTEVQALARAGDQVLPCALVGRAQPALGVIDDANRCVAIADDIGEAANRLITIGCLARQQAGFGNVRPR